MSVEISVVIPIFNEQNNLVQLYNELKHVLDYLKKPYEIVFVDDGSTDNSYQVLKKIHKDKKVRVIKLRGNFGQTAAFNVGFKNSKGKIVITMDSDLQNDPRDIPKLLSKIKQGFDVVSGWRYKRRDSIAKILFSKLSNSLRIMMTGEKIHDSGCSLKAYKKEILKDVDLFGEMHRFIPTLLAWKGYRIGEVKVNHRPRRHGKTKYNTKRLVKGFLDLLVVLFWQKYSARPIHLFGGAGLLSFAAGVIIALYLTVMKIFYGVALANRPLLLFSILLILFGSLLLLFGILADIMIKIYYKDRPVYSVEEKLNGFK